MRQQETTGCRSGEGKSNAKRVSRGRDERTGPGRVSQQQVPSHRERSETRPKSRTIQEILRRQSRRKTAIGGPGDAERAPSSVRGWPEKRGER